MQETWGAVGGENTAEREGCAHLTGSIGNWQCISVATQHKMAPEKNNCWS